MKPDTTLFIAVSLLITLLAGTGMYFSAKIDRQVERENKFIGACDYLGGKVHDDLCVKDDRVVLRMNK